MNTKEAKAAHGLGSKRVDTCMHIFENHEWFRRFINEEINFIQGRFCERGTKPLHQHPGSRSCSANTKGSLQSGQLRSTLEQADLKCTG